MILRTLLPICLISLSLSFSATALASDSPAEIKLPAPVIVKELPLPLAPISHRGYSTLPGWSGGYRYNFNADNNSLTSLRLFLKRKTRVGHSFKVAWERQTGIVPNFFKTGTVDGVSFGNTGTFFVEQEIKF